VGKVPAVYGASDFKKIQGESAGHLQLLFT